MLTLRFFKIPTFWSYHLHLREKSQSFVKLQLRAFLIGSAHVRSQATRACLHVHAAHAVCMWYEDIDYTFQRARVASIPEVPKVTWWKIATFHGYHLHWLISLWYFATFQKNRTPACYFSADVSRVLMRTSLVNLHRNVAIFLMSQS